MAEQDTSTDEADILDNLAEGDLRLEELPSPNILDRIAEVKGQEGAPRAGQSKTKVLPYPY